jgi:integrase/recombinase XerD
MRVQRVAYLDADEQSWTVLGADWRPVPPVEQFLAHLSDQRRSPNTVKAYAHDLKDYFEYLEHRSLAWDRLRYDERSASFNNVAVLPELLPGHVVADMIAILGSMFFVVGDIDK